MPRDLPIAQAASTVASYGVAQLCVAAGSILRLPFLLDALGDAGLGLTIVIGGFAPLLLSTTGGVRLASRTILSEEIGRATADVRERAVALVVMSRRLAAAQLAVTALLAISIPFHSLLNASGVVSPAEMRFTVLGAVVLCASAVPGSRSWGHLEAEGRLVLLNGLIGGAALINLAATVTLAQVTTSFAVFALLSVGSSAVPYCVAPLFARGLLVRTEERDHEVEVAAWKATGIGTVKSIAPFATRAMDPVVVSAELGPSPAAAFGIAQRLAALTTFLPVAVGPLVTAYFARRRGTSAPVGYGGVARLSRLYGLTAVAGGAVIIVAGPALSRWLTAGEIEPPRGLFVALALLGVTASVHNAFHSAGTSPSSLKFAVRVDLFTTVLNVGLSIFLVRSAGLAGPAYASVVATTIAALLWRQRLMRNPDDLRETHLR